MKNLDFTLSMVDKLTRPLKTAQASLKSFGKESEDIFKKIGINGAVVYAAGRSIGAFLAPALKIQDALNQAASKGIGETALKKLTSDALYHSVKYGKSAESYIASTVAIRGAIRDLTDIELPRYAMATNILAASTKSSAEEAAAYMGDMYTRFKSTADRMGRVNWAENLAGKTAYLSESFNLDPAKIQGLMSGSKGLGNAYGISMNEQLAVMAELSRTMGSGAGGAYEKFLKSAIDGGNKLNMSFTDANDQLLSMPELLGKLQSRYGKTIEGNLRAQREIEKAFGTGSEVIQALYHGTDKLNGYIKDLGNNDGMARAAKLASKLASPVEQLQALTEAVRISIGNAMLPVLTPLLEKIINIGNQFTRWMQLFPNIARMMGYLTLGIMSFAAAIASVNIITGIILILFKSLKIVVIAAKSVWVLFTAVIWLWNNAALIVSQTMKIVRGTIMAVGMAARLAGISFTFMSWPVLLVVGIIALLVLGVIALIKYWGQIKTAISDSLPFKLLAGYINQIAGIFTDCWDLIKTGWQHVCLFFEDFSFTDTFNHAVDAIANLFSGLWDSIKNQFSAVYNSIVHYLNKIPGIDIELKAIPAPVAPVTSQSLLTGGQVSLAGKAGGIKQSLNNSSAVDNSHNIQTVNIYPANPEHALSLMDWAKLNAG